MACTCVDTKMEHRKVGYCNMYSEQTTRWATKESYLDSRKKQEIFLFSEVPQIGLEPTYPPIQ